MTADSSIDRGGGQKPSSKVQGTIIEQDDHPIRPGDLDREALKVLYRLRDAGFAAYLVGGGVRDLYLGKRPKDFDISTNAHPGQLRKLFRNSRTIGRRFRLVQVFYRGNKIIEVSTLRSQSEYDIRDSKVLPSNNTFGTLEEDAFRRDLTINSLFYEIENNTIIDYVGGVADLNDGIVRIVGDPEVRITRDPVRMLRAVRHAARAGFTIEDRTWQAIVAQRDQLNLCPTSRIRDELLKDLVSGCSRPWAEKCVQSGILFTLFPFYESLLAGDGEKQQLYSILNVIDRLHGNCGEQQVRLPEYMLFAAILFPWIEKEFDLLNREVKGGGYRTLLTEIRVALEEVICTRFNIKRSAKEAITTLYVNMPSFQSYRKEKNWPKWLKKKSYFDDCVQFSALIEEAGGGPKAAETLFAGTPKQDNVTLQESGGGSGRGRRGGNPVFTSQKGGVFGLR
ncbi:MAG: polya polymerase [Desulfobulbaceae bacterium]|nr:polya polymerase [Desulfobulbaceae bacterium]